MSTSHPMTDRQRATRERALANVAAADAAQQERLDEARKPYLEHAAARRQEETAARQQEQERREVEQRAKEEAAASALEGTLRTRYLAAGGTAERWEREKEQVIAAHLERVTLAGDEAARVANATRYRQP
jgi:hypothetical protein